MTYLRSPTEFFSCVFCALFYLKRIALSDNQMANLPPGVLRNSHGVADVDEDYLQDKVDPVFFPHESAMNKWDENQLKLQGGDRVCLNAWLPRTHQGIVPGNLMVANAPNFVHLCDTPSPTCTLRCSGAETCELLKIPAGACAFFARDGICTKHRESCNFPHYVVDRQNQWYTITGANQRNYLADVQKKSVSQIQHTMQENRVNREQREKLNKEYHHEERLEEAQDLAMNQARHGNRDALKACAGILLEQNKGRRKNHKTRRTSSSSSSTSTNSSRSDRSRTARHHRRE